MTNVDLPPPLGTRSRGNVLPEELRWGVGTGPYVAGEADRGAGSYLLTKDPDCRGPKSL